MTPEQQIRHDQIYDQRSILSEGTGLQHHVDHHDSLKAGGAGNDPDNLQIVKESLNLKKGAKTSGPAYEAARRDGINNGRLFRRMLALGLSREAQVEFIRHRTPKPLPKPSSTAKVVNTSTAPSFTSQMVPTPQIGTLQGGGHRVDLDPFTGASIMLP